MVQFCRTRYAYAMPTTQIMSCKLNLQHPHDSRTQPEKCRGILKLVLRPYDSRSHNQNARMTSCLRSLPDASSVCYESRIQQS